MINENMSLPDQKRKATHKHMLVQFKDDFDRALLNIFKYEETDNIFEAVLCLLDTPQKGEFFWSQPEDEAPYFVLAFIELYPEAATVLVNAEHIIDYKDDEELHILDLMYEYYDDLLEKRCSELAAKMGLIAEGSNFFKAFKKEHCSKSWGDMNCPQYEHSKIVH